jgi:hypothetical protein
MKIVQRTRLLTAALTAFTILLTSLGLASTPAFAACAPLPSDKGQATFTINLPSTANYRVWSRLYSPSANNNGFYMQVDQTYCTIVVGDSATIPVGTFTWVNYRDAQPSNLITLNLASGTHTVVIAGLDPGVGIDRIMFLSDLSCVPSGKGDNCNATTAPTTPTTPPTSQPAPGTPAAPTPVVIGTSGPSAPVSGTLVLSTPQSTNSGVTDKVAYSVDGTPIAGNTLDTTTLANGEHTITATTTNPDGTTSLKTTTITTDNHINFWQWLSNLFAAQWWWVRVVLAVLVFTGMVWIVLFRRFHSKLRLNRRKVSNAPMSYLETLNADQGKPKL